MTTVNYAQAVGERLRNVRFQKTLSLHDVEVTSRDEFKASVLGAYERGARSISVPRLQRLARFYGVPVDQRLPPEAPDVDLTDDTGEGDAGIDTGETAMRRAMRANMPEKVTIDLTRIGGLNDP